MERRFSFLMVLLSVMTFSLSMVFASSVSEAKTKHITISKISGDKLFYHKACGVVDIYKESEYDNVIGHGKKKVIRISNKCKYHLLNFISMKPYKTAKTKFKKKVKEFGSHRARADNGAIYYWEMAAKITIKNNKVIKIVQEFQS